MSMLPYGKRDSVAVSQLQVLRWGDYPGLSGWAPCKHKGPFKREVVELVIEGSGMTESEVGMMCFKYGGRGLEKLDKARK